MADRNVNNWEYPLQAAMTAGQLTLDVVNAAAVRLQDEAFALGDTVVLTLFEADKIEAVRVSARTIDGGGAGIARLTVDARGVEEVSETAAAGIAFNALTTTVHAGTTAGQIQTIRDTMGGATFTWYEYTTNGTKNVDLSTNPMVHIITSGLTADITINLTTPAINSMAYRAIIDALPGGAGHNIIVTVDGSAITVLHPVSSLPVTNDAEWHRIEVDVWRNASGTIHSVALVESRF